MRTEKLLLQLDVVVSFHPQMSRALGGNNQALFVQQMYFWSDKGSRSDGFIYKTKEDIERETCLTVRQQDKIVKELKELGVLETKLKKANGSPTLHYKLDIPLLQKVINESNQKYDSESYQKEDSLTEITQEITTREESVDSPNLPTPQKIAIRFFSLTPEDLRSYANKLAETNGADSDIVLRELRKFTSYWTEKNKTGTKMKWQLEKTFEVNRRLATWFSNVRDFKKSSGGKYTATEVF